MSSTKQYNQFQLFVLASLTAEEQRQEENGEAFGRPNTNNLPLNFRYVTTISQLSLKVPPSFIPDQPSGKEILSSIKVQIDELRDDELLRNDPQFSNNREPQDQGFYVTAGGRLYIRKHYQGLIAVIENKQKYEQIIDSLESDSNSKKHLKSLRKRL